MREQMLVQPLTLHCNVVVSTSMSSFNSEGTLTWHDGVIPGNEVWIKLGGDNGSGAFKMNSNFKLLIPVHPTSL